MSESQSPTIISFHACAGYLMSYTFPNAIAKCCSCCLCISHVSMFLEMLSKLTFTMKTMGLKRNARRRRDIARDFTSTVDHILKSHSGFGLKGLKLDVPYYCNVKSYMNSWLNIAITPGIEEVSLMVPSY